MANLNSSNKVALLALFSLLPIFIFVIGNGWASILAPMLNVSELPAVDRVVAYVAGFLFGFVAVILAWGVASERARLRYENTARYAWLAYLMVLVGLSALGTMNWLFKVSETPTFIKETIVETEKHMTTLLQVAESGIVLTRTQAMKQEQKELEGRLNGLVAQLSGELEALSRQRIARQDKEKAEIVALADAFEAELLNPLRAGCGEVAQGYLAQIREKLPDLRLPSGSCRDANPDIVVKTYREAIQKAIDVRFGVEASECENSQAVKAIAAQIELIIKVLPSALGSGCPSTETIISDTEKAVSKYLESLPDVDPEEKTLKELRERTIQRLEIQITVLNKIYQNDDSLQKAIAGPALKEAWSVYRAVYQSLEQVVDPARLVALPTNIEDQRIDKIGNVANTIEILASRYDHMSTYPIILAGILFDLILIAFFYRIEVVKVDRRRSLTGHEERLRGILSSLEKKA
jgi:hypothetical protein